MPPSSPSQIPPFLSCDANDREIRASLPGFWKVYSDCVFQKLVPLPIGLRTPPAEDDMTTTHNVMTAYNTFRTGCYKDVTSVIRHPNPTATTVPFRGIEGGSINHIVEPPARQPQHNQHQITYDISTTCPSGARLSTPGSSGRLSNHSGEGTVSRKDSTMVTHSLELPDCISPQGGRLDDFAALMTCFFWFESIDTIQAAEDIDSRPSQQPMPLLSRHTEPHPAFKIWLNSILTTTQVTQNVVLLALLFIYRLKKANPRVHGNPGSEYRLFTVALMLGNKFLDDNTYTNKTWAEVSGLSVKEIHVMEVEFLSNMRYGLLTSKEQWDEWLKKLACYGKYCLSARLEEQAMAARYIPTQRVHVSPNQGRFTTPLPSPTTMLPTGVSATPLLGAVYSPSSVSQPAWDSGYQPVVSPLAAKPSLGHELVRKRSFEVNDLVEPAPKRMSRRPATTVAPAIQPAPSTQESVRLPTPHLTLDTSQATLPDLPQYGQAYYQSQSKLPLPPLNPGMRAMSTVYSTPTSWAPQGSMVASSGPQTPYVVHSNYGTPTKGHSPTGLPTLGSSPMAEAYACHTPMANSPSVYLQQRASPYKPVRRVNTLLNPPPSIPLSEYHLSAGEMHYQPLGRRNDLRTGIVPEFRSAYTPPEHQFLQMFRPFYPGGHDQPHMR